MYLYTHLSHSRGSDTLTLKQHNENSQLYVCILYLYIYTCLFQFYNLNKANCRKYEHSSSEYELVKYKERTFSRIFRASLFTLIEYSRFMYYFCVQIL